MPKSIEEKVKEVEQWLSDYYQNYHCDGNIIYGDNTPAVRLLEIYTQGKRDLMRGIKAHREETELHIFDDVYESYAKKLDL